MKRLIYLLLIFLFSSVTQTYGQSLREYKLPLDQTEAKERFGWAISIDSIYVGVGAPYYNERKGTAYIYQWNGEFWLESEQINSSDGVEGDEFGKSIAIKGDYAIIGANMEGTKPGAAYVFKKNGTKWIEKQKLIPSDGEIADEFGYSAAITSDYVMIGAWMPFGGQGAVYIFYNEDDVWIETQKLSSSIAWQFGEVLAADDDWLFIGASASHESQQGSIYAYKLEQTEWVIKDTIFADDGFIGDDFATSISYDGEFLMAIAAGNDAAYLFENSGDKWVQNIKIETGARAVAINLPFMALGDNAYPGGEGSVSFFNDMILKRTLYASDGVNGNWFGSALAISDEFLVVGSDGINAAYIYHINELDDISFSSINDRRELSAMKYMLLQNYPNPFNTTTKIQYSLPKTENVIITLYNINGQSIKTLLNNKMPAGFHEISYNAYNLSSGIYYYRIRAGEFQAIRKMILIK